MLKLEGWLPKRKTERVHDIEIRIIYCYERKRIIYVFNFFKQSLEIKNNQ